MSDILPCVHLRAIEPEDLDELYKIENDHDVWGVGNTTVPYSRYALYDYVAHAQNDIYADRQVRLMIENAQHEVVGIIDIIDFDPKHLRAEIGIVICQSYRKKGFAQAAIEEIKRYALSVLHLHQLYAYIDVDNQASISTFKKCGFTIDNQLKDWIYDGKSYRNVWLMQYFF